MQSRIMIVEDDTTLQGVISDFLQDEGFVTEIIPTGSLALNRIDKSQPDLVLLDLGLPDIKGETVLLKIREDYPEIPIVILTAKSNPAEIAAGLNLGADDYLPKPFAAEELLARINARIKNKKSAKSPFKVADLKLDPYAMTVVRGDKSIDLTKTEFELLRFLLSNAGRITSREVILNHVWGYTTDVESRVVDVYIGYLREKIDKDHKIKLIKNKRGFGYYIDANADEKTNQKDTTITKEE